LPGEPRARFLLCVQLVPTAEGGRDGPILAGRPYRPQLFIGQTFRDGTRSEWDCEWTFDSPAELNPGDEGVVAARLMGLPDGALLEDHHLEFYEGARKVATGYVVSVERPGRSASRAESDPLVFAMRDAFDGAVITSVFHEMDGDWQFLTGPAVSPDQAQLVHLSHVMSLDPTLDELRDLPMGYRAHRDAADQPWQIDVDED
jgi:hypothetical protein